MNGRMLFLRHGVLLSMLIAIWRAPCVYLLRWRLSAAGPQALRLSSHIATALSRPDADQAFFLACSGRGTHIHFAGRSHNEIKADSILAAARYASRAHGRRRRSMLDPPGLWWRYWLAVLRTLPFGKISQV